MSVQYVKEKIWDWCGNEFVPWLGVLFRGMLNAFVRFLGPVAVIVLKISTIVMIALEMTYAAISQLAFSLHELVQMELFKPNGALLTYGVFMNRFLPLTETFALAILVCNIYVLVIVFRWIKSLIPTMSN